MLLRLKDLPVCGIVKIEACTVVCVHPVRAGVVGKIAPERQVGFVQLGGVGGGLCHGYDMAGAEEKQNLVQRTANVVMPGREKLLVKVVCAAQAEQLHRFGQVDRPADGVLGIDRGDHQPLAQKQLVFHLCGVGIGGEIEGQRAEVGAVLQRGLHELAVQVGHKRVAQLQHFAEGGHFCAELVVFLIPGAGAGMVAHQRGKEAEFQPAQSQIGRCVAVKAAEIRPGVEETAHLDIGHHLDVGQQLRPRGVVVAQPDAAVPVGADEAGAAVQQGALVGAQFAEGFPGGVGHVAAIEVVDPVVADGSPLHLMVEAGVICGVVHQAHDLLDQTEEFVVFKVVLPTSCRKLRQHGLEALGGVEESRFVHVIPETLDAEVGQDVILLAEPLPHLGAEKIGEIRLAGPDGGDEGSAVSLFAEIAFFQPFPAGRVFGVDPDPGVNDGHQPDALGFEIVRKGLQIRETALVDRKIGEILHIVDVHADHVQRQAVFFVLPGDLPDVGFALVSKPALRQTECPFGRDVASADELPEGLTDGRFALSGQDVEVIIRLVRGKAEDIVVGIADVIPDFAREIDKDTEAIAADAVSDEQKIVRTIVRKLVLAVVGFVGVVGDVVPAALVDAAGHFAKAVHDGILSQREAPAAAVGSQKRNRAFCSGQRLHDAAGGEGMSKGKTLDQRDPLLCIIGILP